jgi:hypothetical protein
MVDPNDGFRTVSVSGQAQSEEEGADDLIDRLAHKYLGVDRYPNRSAEERITVHVRPSASSSQPAAECVPA